MSRQQPKSPFSFFDKKRILEYLSRIDSEFKIVQTQFSGLSSHIKSLGDGIDNLVEKFTGYYVDVQKFKKEAEDIYIEQEYKIASLERKIEELKKK